MDLLVIRHAISMSRSDFTGSDDSERPLTKEGREKMRDNCNGLWNIAPDLDLLVTSPFTRARQTADIVVETYSGDLEVVETETLVPSAEPEHFGTWLIEHFRGNAVAIVGHEPSLSTISSWLLSGLTESFIDLRKGSGLLIDLSDSPEGGTGELQWYLIPRQLRMLGK